MVMKRPDTDEGKMVVRACGIRDRVKAVQDILAQRIEQESRGRMSPKAKRVVHRITHRLTK
jgi:hypothetical protein